jgi:hypothetical protein
MYQLDYGVRRGRQKPVDEVKTGDRLGLGAAVALELRPNPSEGGQRPIIVEGKPDYILLLVSGLGSGRIRQSY